MAANVLHHITKNGIPPGCLRVIGDVFRLNTTFEDLWSTLAWVCGKYLTAASSNVRRYAYQIMVTVQLTITVLCQPVYPECIIQ